MAKSMRKVLAIVGTLALLVALVASFTGRSQAANLTGGQYTYVINGEESTFPFDPIIRKDGLLLPAEVFQRVGIQVAGLTTKQITMTKDTVTEVVNVGTTAGTLNGVADNVATAPLRLNGRVFLPASVLADFGVDVTQDGTFVIIRNYTDGLQKATTLSDADWSNKSGAKSFTASLKADSNIYLSGTFTFLTPDLINTTNIGLNYGARARLLSLIQSNSLVLVHLSNTAFKSGALTTGLYLVDGNRNEYDLIQAFDAGQGLVTSKLAPGADRIGVLVFPKIQNLNTTLTLYYDANNGTVGSFTSLQ
ncbi:MAG: stalk domain-containing protein [Mycobacterium leprae]